MPPTLAPGVRICRAKAKLSGVGARRLRPGHSGRRVASHGDGAMVDPRAAICYIGLSKPIQEGMFRSWLTSVTAVEARAAAVRGADGKRSACFAPNPRPM